MLESFEVNIQEPNEILKDFRSRGIFVKLLKVLVAGEGLEPPTRGL